MTATAEHVLQEIRSLPPPDLRAVWQEVNELVAKLPSPPHLTPVPPRRPEEMRAALDRLTGCSAGSHSLERLLEERRRDREREEDQLQDYLARRQASSDA